VSGRGWEAKCWYMSWCGDQGVTVCRSTRTSDRAAAERIAQATQAQLPPRKGNGRARAGQLSCGGLHAPPGER
jgi:hypothetical protein